MNLATWAFRSGKFDAALDYTKKALALNPDVPDTNLKMALCLERLGKPEEALSWCEKALRLNPLFLQARLTKADLALALGRKAEALKIYDAVLPKYGDRVTGQDWLTYGFLLAERSRWDDARRAFERATDMSPKDPRAWYNLARVARLQGREAASRAALERAEALAPDAVRRWLASDPILGRPKRTQ
jgi:tetratricopeptide (TPR) repeat protein